jgi:cytochrome P450
VADTEISSDTTIPQDDRADALLAATILTDEGRQDPYPAYAELRRAPGRWRASTGSVVLTRYQESLEALRHPRLGRAEADMDLPPSIGATQRQVSDRTATMLLLNPPDHTRIRGLVSRAFTPRRVDELRPTIAALLDPVLDEFALHGGGDVMADLAVPYPVAVISELLGVPRDGNEHIRPLVRAGTALIDSASTPEVMAAGEAAVGQLAAYFYELIEEKRRHPDDRLLSALIQVEEAGDRLSMEELIANTILLYAAGFETTSNLIGNGLRLLLEHPEQMRRLRAAPELIGPAMLEILRADSPVQMNVRVALDTVELFGESHPRGSSFVILQGSANHDDEVYPDGEGFDVARFAGGDAPQPLSFGWGAHHCLGAHLARAEGEIVFGALLDRFERIELDVDALATGVTVYRPSFTLRGLESLPVRVS